MLEKITYRYWIKYEKINDKYIPVRISLFAQYAAGRTV